jgi:cytochrome c peroxidase
MKRMMYSLVIVLLIVGTGWSFTSPNDRFQLTSTGKYSSQLDSIRRWYEQPIEKWPIPLVDASVNWKELGVLPASVLSRDSAAQPLVALGKLLFFDPRLSGSNQISCATCHEPELGWSNGRTTGIGHDHRSGNRNVPSLFNIGHFKEFFWDGRSPSLEKQVMAPLSNELEMHELPGALEEELLRIPLYRNEFKKVFGTSTIHLDQITQAIAAFEKSITSKKSAFDLFLEGRFSAMSDEQVLGLHVFRTKAGCMNCHHGALFTDQKFHNIGLSYYGRKFEDLGRYQVTGEKEDVGKFRTPSLRDVMLTRPWMHNGLFDDMEGIINLYNAGGARPQPREDQKNDTLFPTTSPLLKPLGLSLEEKKALVAFMEAISSKTPHRMPRPIY